MKVRAEFIPLDPKQCEALKAEAAKETSTLIWTSLGLTGKKLRRPLDELDTAHLENILITQVHTTPIYKAAILSILKEKYQAGL